jgi:NAD(P)-dependent dehydrogenase (short-subunit alcohol dehydrogenase family)
MLDLKGTSSVVTGGASGIGEAAARGLAARGAKVVIADLNGDRGKQIADELGGAYVHCDVTETDTIIGAVDAAVELGPLRTCVTAAGIGWPARTIGKDGDYASAHDLEIYKKVLAINLIGTFDTIRLAATKMSQTEPVDESGSRGAICTIASIAAFDGQIGQAAYSSSKGGVVGMTLPVARDLAVVGIRVNCVVPGLIDTPIYGSGPQSEAFKDKLKRDVLFPSRLGTADELASMVLESLTNSYINAEVIRVDGGARLQPK